MIPYDSMLYFYILALPLVGAIILGFSQKPMKMYGVLVTLIMLAVICDTGDKRLYLGIYFLYQYVLVFIYLRIRASRKSVWGLWLIILLAIAPLVIDRLFDLAGLKTVALLGISYMTFRAVQTIIDIYDGLITRIKLTDYIYYILFFPTISSGPIDRYRRFLNDIDIIRPREEYFELLKTGIWKLMTGIFYSFVIAVLINTYWLSAINGTGVRSTVSYMYAYSLYVFFNFAGYSSMAIGTGYLLGVKVPENFNMPFLSKDLKDFWGRWHISLSTWFRDYIYSRFVTLTLKKRVFKNIYYGSYIGYVITMMTMGLWHGLEDHYIVYGIYHGLLMCVNDILDQNWKRFKKLKREDKYSPVFYFITFNLVCFGLLIFSGKLF